jgi:phosphoglycerate dehydrogenase-like enzyme
MARPIVLVLTGFLFARRKDWGTGFDILGPDAISVPLEPQVAERVEIIVNAGEELDKTLIGSLPNLKLVACFSTGYAGIDVGYLRSRGIELTTAAGINAHDVADHAIALMLSWWHGIPGADRAVRHGNWRGAVGHRRSLRGKYAGIVGLGRIGSAIAQRADALGMTVQWWGPRDKPGASYPKVAHLEELARDSDVLIVASRATAESAGQIDDGVLKALGPQGLLVNVSRGFLVDEAALVAALSNETLGGAALDVFAQEPPNPDVWKDFGNVVLTPHIAGYTVEAGLDMFRQLRENIQRQLAGQPLLTPVADPD